MPIIDWSSVSLATYSDVIARHNRAYDLTGKPGLADQQAEITAKLADAKAVIGDWLTARFRGKILEMDLAATVDIRDYIANPAVLKRAAVALALQRMFQANLFRDEGYYFTQMEVFRVEYSQEMDLAANLLQFDKDADGAVDQGEAADGQYTYRFRRT